MAVTLGQSVGDRYERVLECIAAAARAVGRDPGEVRLVVVTKSHPVEIARAVVAAGARCLGENYAEEGVEKMRALDNPDVAWHMIGHVQSRKADLVAEHYAWMHSLDRLKIACRLDQFSAGLGRKLPVLLECNVSGEDSKYGFPAWEEGQWPAFGEQVAAILDLASLRVRGLMTMPPWDPDPEASRPYFRRLVSLQQYLRRRFPQADWDELSIGMSNDFEVAIQEGATMVRVGTAIVGPRE